MYRKYYRRPTDTLRCSTKRYVSFRLAKVAGVESFQLGLDV